MHSRISMRNGICCHFGFLVRVPMRSERPTDMQPV
jgi:hypothetical protein